MLERVRILSVEIREMDRESESDILEGIGRVEACSDVSIVVGCGFISKQRGCCELTLCTRELCRLRVLAGFLVSLPMHCVF